jgi:peptidoglycan/LPS O-acetylase OafA/YrhL
MKAKLTRNHGFLSKNDTNIIKGVGILMIIFHNFFHLIEKATGENEFSFSEDNFRRFIDFSVGTPLDFTRFASSYFGHYGVQLFIFISSYGLYLSYAHKNISWFPFMKKRIIKLYPTLVLGIALSVLINLVQLKILPGLPVIKSILLKLTLLYGFVPNEALTINGPWWFFSLIVQLYAIFPFLLWLLRKAGPDSLLIVIFLFIGISMALDLFIGIPGTSVYFTFIGQLPVFSLGLYFAARGQIKISTTILLMALVIFSLGNINQYAWYFSFLAVTLIMLKALIWAIPIIRKFANLNFFLEFTGSVSLYLFVVNGLLRHRLITTAEKYNNPFITLGLSFVFLAFVYLTALILRSLEKQLMEFIDSGFKIRTLLQKIKTNKY